MLGIGGWPVCSQAKLCFVNLTRTHCALAFYSWTRGGADQVSHLCLLGGLGQSMGCLLQVMLAPLLGAAALCLLHAYVLAYVLLFTLSVR